MIVKIGDIEIKPLPEVFSITSGQKLAVLEFPDGDTLVQNFGRRGRRISLSGLFESYNALHNVIELEKLKDKGEELLFIAGDFSTKVYIESFSWQQIRRGHIRYSLELVESTVQEIEIKTREPVVSPVDQARKEAASIRAELASHPEVDPLGEISRALWNIEQKLINIVDQIGYYTSLMDMPQRFLKMLEGHLGFVLNEIDVALTHVKDPMNADQFSMEAEEIARKIMCFLREQQIKFRFMLSQVREIPPKDRHYRVQIGDTLQSISTKFYGTPSRWQDIAFANNIVDPSSIRPGDLLLIPADESSNIEVLAGGGNGCQ